MRSSYDLEGAEAREKWLEEVRRTGDSRHTVRAYHTAYRQFFEWAEVPAGEVSTELAQAWANHMVGRGLADRTINLKLAALSSFYDFLGSRADGGRAVSAWPAKRCNPFDGAQRRRVFPYARVRSPTLAEAQALLSVINTACLSGARDFALLYTILVTCRRAAEVLGIRWGDIRPTADGNYAITYRNQEGDRREVLNRLCHQAMCAYLELDGRPPGRIEPDDIIFAPVDPLRVRRLPLHSNRRIEANRPLSVSFVNRMLKKYARRAGVDPAKAHVHGLRHTGARLRLQLTKGSRWRVDQTQVKELLARGNTLVTCDRGAIGPRTKRAAPDSGQERLDPGGAAQSRPEAWEDPLADAVAKALLPRREK